MKLQTKLSILLLLIIFIFMIAFKLYINFETKRLVLLFKETSEEKSVTFDKIMKIKGAPIETLSRDYTYWDEMVNFVASGDKTWASQNLDTALSTFNVNAVWVFKTDRTSVYHVNNLENPDSKDISLPGEIFNKLFKESRFCHFFLNAPSGLMEIRGATIHPTADVARETPPQGYFFAGRLWNEEYLAELSEITGGRITIVPVTEEKFDINVKPEKGIIKFSNLLSDWDDKPVMRLEVLNESLSIKNFNRSSRETFIMLLVFSGSILVILFIFSVRFINIPLKLISNALNTEETGCINNLQKHRNEFGDIAKLISNFFEQRKELVQKRELLREIAERRKREEELRKVEDQLRHAQKMEAVGALAGGIAHDFNNILTAIIGNASLLQSRIKEDDKLKGYAGEILTASGRAANLTKSLLTFSRKQETRTRQVNLNEIVRGIEKLLLMVIGKGIKLNITFKEEPLTIMADSGQIEQVLMNLATNARDAMPDGGSLTITTELIELDSQYINAYGYGNPGMFALVYVTDTGTGMDEKTKEKIFEPFFTTKEIGKGTGLGLSMVYGIVKHHNGYIDVQTELGKGSTFRIYLPVIEREKST